MRIPRRAFIRRRAPHIACPRRVGSRSVSASPTIVGGMYSPRTLPGRIVPTILIGASALVLAACTSQSGSSDSPTTAASPTEAVMTPVIVNVTNEPVPFTGSDAKTYLAYELDLTNFTAGDAIISRVEVIDPATATTIMDMDAKAIDAALVPVGGSRSTDVEDPANSETSPDNPDNDAKPTMSASTSALLYINVALEPGTSTPTQLSHRVTTTLEVAPPDTGAIVEEIAPVSVSEQSVASLQNPLRGTGLVAADSCCDSQRHRRAALAINNEVFLAQRFAADWEQVDAAGKIFDGDPADLQAYTIYGQDAYAVADATVVAAVDGQPDQVPPTLKDVTLQNADGNHVVLDLGDGNYALYAHLIPGSVAVSAGDTISAGQVLGKVGNSGNSIAPHLHFHVMSTPSPLASNGLPFLLSEFTVTGRVAGETPAARTAAFDKAEAKGTVLPVGDAPGGTGVRTNEFPLDQLVVTMN